MSSLEAKKEQFRKYLEQCGVIDALTKALIKLYDEFEKPEDALRFIRKHMCESCPDDAEYDRMKFDYEECKKKIAKLEKELYFFKGNIKRTPSEILNNLKAGFENLKEDDDCRSLLKKHLTEELFKKLSPPLETSNKANLLDIIQSGLEFHDSLVGVYAADEESYQVFEDLLKPIIFDYHELNAENSNANFQQSIDWGDPKTIKNLDPKQKYITSTRIELSRNIKGRPFFPVMKEEDFKEIEQICKDACLQLEDKLKGTYTSLSDIHPITHEEMIEKRIMFGKENKYLEIAGAYRFWPTGRGLFRNHNETFLVWVNEEDHMKIISTAKSGHLGEVYKCLINGIKGIEKLIDPIRNETYGYLTANPTNLGTTMHVSVHMKLPKLSKNQQKLNELADELKLEISGLNSTEIDVLNRHKLGYTEHDIIMNFHNSIFELIKVEENL